MSPISRLVAATAAVLLLTGCGMGQPVAYPEQGVDGLEVPTPSPAAADFVRGVDHEFWTLAAGERWEYLLFDGTHPLASLTREVVGEGRVAGVPVTWVALEVTATDTSVDDAAWRDAYAQDRTGNVWWFAREGGSDAFEAGVAGAQAGLVLPATFRVGDSYDMRSVAGESGGWERIDAISVSLDTAMGALDGLIEASGTSFSGAVDGQSAAEARRWFAPGLGLVQEERYDGRTLRLVLHDAGE